jgi:hypothetical protein
MGDAVLADPRGLRQLPVRLNEEFNNALDMETFESDSAPHPVESPKENRVLSMSMDDGMDDGLKWIDAWTTAQEDRAFDDALGFNSATISSWPERNHQALGSETGFLHDGNNAWMAGRQVGAFNDALGLNSGTTSSWSERSNQDLGSENGPLADLQAQTPLATGVWSNGTFNITPDHEMIPGWTSQEQQERRVIAAENGPLADWQAQTPLATGVWSNGAFNNTPDHEMIPGWTTSQEQQERRVITAENGPLADLQAQTPLATGVWSNGAFNSTPDHEMIPGWTTSQGEQQRRVIAAEPGSQAPGVTVNDVALRLPRNKLPSNNQSAMASGYYAQEVLPKVSAGTSLMAERKAACMLQKAYADSK